MLNSFFKNSAGIIQEEILKIFLNILHEWDMTSKNNLFTV